MSERIIYFVPCMCISFSFGLKGLIVNAGAYLVARVHCNTSIMIVQWSENLDRPMMHRLHNQILSAEFKHKRRCCALSCYALNNSRPTSGSENMVRQFTGQQRSFMVSKYHRTGSFVQVQRLFRRQFPQAPRLPSKSTIQRNVMKFAQHATVRNRCAEASGRSRTARSAANIVMVQRALHQDPEISSRRNPLPQLSQSTFSRIIRKDIHWHPYRIQKRHGLRPGDTARRTAFCQWLLQRPQRMLRETLIVDEANFYMNGSVTTSNVRRYVPKGQAPRDFAYDVPNDKRKLVVWCGLVGNRIIGPIFVPGDLTGQRNLDIINNVVVPELIQIYGQQRNGAVRHTWYLQDGATPHRARMVYIRLEQLFPNRVIGLGHGIEWPSRSPDLTPLEFFLFGVLEVQSVLRWPTCNPTGAAATYY